MSVTHSFIFILSKNEWKRQAEKSVFYQMDHIWCIIRIIISSVLLSLPHFHIYFFRGDKKACRHYTGLGDGCDLCRVNPNEWSILALIEEAWPYPMDRTPESYKAVEARMKVNTNGKYPRPEGRGDWQKREGCTGPMKSLRPIFPFSITHKVSSIVKP